MNILYLHTHDMGKYNSIYGYNIEKPNFLNIAKDSTVFRKAFCACPTCSPSRGALLTGMHPQTNGLIGLAHRGFSLNNAENHLSFYLKKFGIHTVLFGEQHEAGNRNKLGYEKIISAPKKKDTDNDIYTAQCAAEYIKNADEPFFLSVGFVSPHRPYKTHTDIDPDYIELPHCIPDNGETRKDFADYMTSVRHADSCAGTVIDALKESGLYDKTVIILTTDHGIAFPFMKCHLYDTGIGVTLAIKTVGERKIKLSDALVSHLDIYPTICDLLNIPYPEWLQGTSLMPILNGVNIGMRFIRTVR
jgi:arylsulfatase A-like enzyme